MKTNLTKEEIHSLTRLGRLEYELAFYDKLQLNSPVTRYSMEIDGGKLNELANEAGYDTVNNFLNMEHLWNDRLDLIIRRLVMCCYTIDDVLYSDRTSYTNAMENSIRKMMEQEGVV